ncbi:MAG: hypothetical protein QOH92_2470 [Chloroflexota bacterium]|nr:hypothetical protein [Chloroflexota bacterium]
MVGAASGPHAPRGEPGAALINGRGKESTQEGTDKSHAVAQARGVARTRAKGQHCRPDR